MLSRLRQSGRRKEVDPTEAYSSRGITDFFLFTRFHERIAVFGSIASHLAVQGLRLSLKLRSHAECEEAWFLKFASVCVLHGCVQEGGL